MRAAMQALSEEPRDQPLRSVTPVGEGKLFGLMPGVCSNGPGFGAKVLSVFADPGNAGRSHHRGIVALFDTDSGELICIADAHEVTRVRTACASAAATDALARPESSTVLIAGCGTQAEAHVLALPLVRPVERILVWGRSTDRAEAFARRMAGRVKAEVTALPDLEEACDMADIICTVTGASEPILFRDWVRPGTHINAVGSSYAGPVEIDTRLVAASRYFVDYRASALAAAAELLRAMEEGLVDETHIAAEIGEVFNGTTVGRKTAEEITLYKSLGHIFQDLAATAYLHYKALQA